MHAFQHVPTRIKRHVNSGKAREREREKKTERETNLHAVISIALVISIVFQILIHNQISPNVTIYIFVKRCQTKNYVAYTSSLNLANFFSLGTTWLACILILSCVRFIIKLRVGSLKFIEGGGVMGRRGTPWDAHVSISSFVRLGLVNRKIVDACKFMELSLIHI